jgi:hypothetical protein
MSGFLLRFAFAFGLCQIVSVRAALTKFSLQYPTPESWVTAMTSNPHPK